MNKEKENQEEQEYKLLLRTINECLTDLECSSEMYTSVLPLLIEKDKERRSIVDSIFKDKVVFSKDKLVTKKSKRTETRKTPEAEQKIPVLSRDEVELFVLNYEKLNRAKDIFEKQAIVMLASRFDEFLNQYLKIVLKLNPNWMNANDKNITFKELLEKKSIENAINSILLKEVDEIMSLSHEAQIDYIDQKLKIGIKEKFKLLPLFLEMVERRDLFIKCGGVITQQYIDRCKSFK